MPGLPNHHLIHPQFQQRWQHTIRATMRSRIRRTRLGNPQGARDAGAGRTTFPQPWVVYEGEARVQGPPRSRSHGTAGSTTMVGDRILPIAAYLVAEPADVAPALVGDVVEILEAPDDPALVDLTLIVADVSHADIAWQRSYGCDLHQPTIRR